MRFVLVIPHAVILWLLGIASGFVTVVAWFVILTKGEHPAPAFIGAYLRYLARIHGYAAFLTDAYPPFSLQEEPEYPIQIEVGAGSTNRVTVYFRIVLLLPAYLISLLLTIGSLVVGFAGFVVALFTGYLPAPIHNATAAMHRYSLRLAAYALLMQDRYPDGLFGDPSLVANAAPSQFPDIDSIPGASVVSSWSPVQDEVPLQIAPDSVTAWPLVVTRGGKKVILTDLVLGGVEVLGAVILAVVLLTSSAVTPLTNNFWSTNYYAPIANISSAVGNTLQDIQAPTTNWAAITTDCANMTAAFYRAGNVPNYPEPSPNSELVQGLRLVYVYAKVCSTVTAPQRKASQLTRLADYLTQAETHLQLFLYDIPQPI